jgi:hypothetical protein
MRFMPYWRTSPEGACIMRARDGMTLVRVPSAGRFVLEVDQRPVPLLRRLVDPDGSTCAGS